MDERFSIRANKSIKESERYIMIKTTKREFLIVILITLIIPACTAIETPLVVTPSAQNTITESPLTKAAPKITPIPIGDGGFFSNDPCGIPCFYGISPGITEENAINIIESKPDFFTNCQTFDNTSFGGVSGIDCENINVGFENGYVYDVSFFPSVQITFRRVIEKYGSPSFIGVYSSSVGDSPPKVEADVMFDQINTIISSVEQDGTIIDIEPDTLVYFIVYLSESAYDRSKNLSYAVPWKGYGKYSVRE